MNEDHLQQHGIKRGTNVTPLKPIQSQNSRSTSFQTPPRPTQGAARTPLSSVRRSRRKEPTKHILDEPKTIYLIRHGQSLGQAASPEDRLTNAALQDCRLSPLGVEQAHAIPDILGKQVYDSIQLIICSPLARAMETAILAFPDKSIRVHHDLREIGSSKVPENVPRSDSFESLRHLHSDVALAPSTPAKWFRRHDVSPRVVRRDQVRKLLHHSLALDESLCPPNVHCIAVVCHYHVIRAALADPYSAAASSLSQSIIQPQNAVPIKCILDVFGVLRLSDDGDEQVPVKDAAHDSDV
ncbi:hypothetical protein MPSEU_001000900 [Mayamaea pseudoterrestris]|nr:hypothetical protein MPSEU_001000900 [Mayamaea pseudoterrestris]